MDPTTSVQTADAVQGLVGGVVKLAKKILQARREVKNLPKDIDELLEEIAALEPVADSIEAGSSDQNEFLKPRLEKLHEELDRASNQLDHFKERQEQDKSSTFAKVAKATVNRGDGKRNREIRSIRETIKGLREELDKALTASTYLTGESTHTIVKETHLKVDALYHRAIVASVNPPAIIAKLDRWAGVGVEDESYKVRFMTWDDEKNGYRLPEQENRRETEEDSEDEEGEIKRGAREGGWEVKNGTKVQFHIDEVPRDCFFHVLSYEKPLTVPTHLELFFPKHSSHRNKLLFPGKRRFPDTIKYRKTDPLSCKVDQSLESLKAGIEGQVVFYLVFSAELLVHFDMAQAANMKAFIEQFNLIQDPSERGDLPFYVKRFVFDVK